MNVFARQDVQFRLMQLVCKRRPALKGTAWGSTTELVAGLGLDSLDMIELTIEAEEEFGIDEIPDDAVEGCKTFGELVELVCTKLGAAKGGAA